MQPSVPNLARAAVADRFADYLDIKELLVADWDDAFWPAADSAPSRADRRGGPYSTYRPDLLVERPLTLAADVSELAGRVEASVRRLGELPGSRGLEGLARFLLRSEAIASSRIEGLQVSPQQVGLAEVAEEESLTAENVNRTAKKVGQHQCAAEGDSRARGRGRAVGGRRRGAADAPAGRRTTPARRP